MISREVQILEAVDLPNEAGFTLQQLGMPLNWFSEGSTQEAESTLIPRTSGDAEPRVIVPISRVVVQEPFKTVLEVVDLNFRNTELFDKSAITLVITGGGASPALGQNIKLGMELERGLFLVGQEQGTAVKVKRIIFLPNISGAAREVGMTPETQLSQKSTSLELAGNVASTALKKMDISGKIVLIGFSAGGAQSIETAASLEQMNLEAVTQVDLVLLDTAGTTDVAEMAGGLHKMGAVNASFNFSLAALPRAYLKNRRIFGVKESWRRAKNEMAVTWVTKEGKLSGLRHLLREVLSPQKANQAVIDSYGFQNPAKPELLTTPTMTRSVEPRDKLVTGRVLNIEMSGAGVVADPASAMLQNDQFPNARGRTSYSLLGATHGSAMVDSSGNSPVTAYYELSRFEGKLRKDFHRLGTGQERVDRLFDTGPYSPISRLIAKWLVSGSSNTTNS